MGNPNFGNVFMNTNGSHKMSASEKQACRAASRAANFY